jgi:TolB protein
MRRLQTVNFLVAAALTTAYCSAADRILISSAAPTAALFISNPDGSAERQLMAGGSSDYNPAWSPTGEWIAFTSLRSGSADLYRVHPDGTGLERLTDDTAYDDQAAFSPDGKKIVFVTTRAAGTANLWILDPETHKTKPLTTGHGGDFRPAWSPDGRWIAFSSDRGSDLPRAKGRWERMQPADIYLVRPDGTGLKRLSAHGDFCGGAKWTPDSRHIIAYCMTAVETFTLRTFAFVRGRAPSPFQGDTHLVQIDIETGKTQPVQAARGIKISPAVVPSAGIAYVRVDKPEGIFYATGKPGPAGVDVQSPSWSADGAAVVYGRFAQNRSTLPVKPWSRSSRYELSNTSLVMAAYDPTGKRLVGAVPGRTFSLVIIDEGGPPRTILRNADWILDPQWSADGRQIIAGVGGYTSFHDFDAGITKPTDPANGGTQVGIVNVDGSGFHFVTSGPNNNASGSFAPDGKRIVYRTEGPDGQGLRVMRLVDRSITVLTTAHDNFSVWSPRGDLIAFSRLVDGAFQVFTIHPDGRDLKRLTHTHSDEVHLAWSPDGERLVFASGRMGFKDEALNTPGPQPYGEIFVMRYDGTQVEQLTDNQWEDGGATWIPGSPEQRPVVPTHN